MNLKHRIIAWDFLKTIAIFLVVWEHCLHYMINGNPYEIAICAWIRSFHMPLFMTLSGIFAINGINRDSYKSFLCKRGERLLIPVVSWSVLFALVGLLMGYEISLFNFILDIFVGNLWFLKCLFVCGLLGYAAFKPKHRQLFWLISTIVFSQLIPLWNISVMYPCFVTGMIVSRNMELLIRNKKITLGITGFIFLTVSLILAFSPDFWVITSGIKNDLFNGKIFDVQHLDIIKKILFRNYGQMLSGISASIFLILGLYLFSHKYKMPIWFHKIADLGKYTIGVYLIQTVIVEMLLTTIISINKDSSILFIYIYSPLLSCALVGISSYFTKFISERFSALSLILFGEHHKSKSTKAIESAVT